MQTALLDYHLPAGLVAQAPCPGRDASRLMVVDRASRSVEHARFSDLPRFLRAGDALIRNTARVIPARLHAFRSGGGSVECLLLRPAEEASGEWWCLLRPGRKLPPGSQFGVAGEFCATVLEKSPDAEFRVRIECVRSGDSVLQLAERLGQIPLPPYIDRRSLAPSARAGIAAQDRSRYQTVFADPTQSVAVAAPTAGLHFTEELLQQIRVLGVQFADVVLHVGLGTFRPIEAEDLADHVMHRERIRIPAPARRILERHGVGARLIAVGTTSLRTTETYARSLEWGRLETGDFHGETDLYIRPPWEFRCVDALITNFHLPRSSLLCLVAAFLAPRSEEGLGWMHELYAIAIRERYRFLSYGDAMLIL